MLTGRHIEAARIHAGIPIFIICNAMNIETEAEYHSIVDKNKKPSVYQQIMIYTLFEERRKSMPILCV
ncbi:MAG: hypothetical protein K2I81_00805 [Alphaproteobacteria bacterium]|nr:hypothetical protein [Alphaproteobacteria bacterium]